MSEDQARRIKTIKMEAKKETIRSQAEMKVAFIDMAAKLHEEAVDVKGLDAMVDSFSANMAASTKKMVRSYADLKAVLTADQMAKAKAIWKKKS